MLQFTSQGVYSVKYSEHEWYGTTDADREHMQMKAMLGAQEAGCLYVGIFVVPDELFSNMGVARNKRVFTHTFDLPIADVFYSDFKVLLEKYLGPGKLSFAQMKTIILRAFG